MLLEVSDLYVWFYKKREIIKAVNGVFFSLLPKETLGLVGESGCGKSITALSIMRLVPAPGEIIKGKIYFLNKNILELPSKEMQKLRGREISMIFQDPMTALNPVFTIGEQIEEVYRYHFGLSKKQARERSIEMLKKVGIPNAEDRINAYPHQLSGGMRQRVMIAMALATHPKLLIADEPTTALDVTIQAQVLELMLNLKKEMNMAILFISHDLTVVAQIAERIAVMYAGKIVEMAETVEIFRNPMHPYTEGLLEAIPRIEHVFEEKHRLKAINGEMVPISTGCAFAPRCGKKRSICLKQLPPLKKVSSNHWVYCWLYE
ncbi:MAG TPA: ABC transporter ATP-binding protein [Candidatus Desulfofervidus auxilii]|uniref:ABC transporter ATP-binding protein n=1 Tax=Desulfofervidus auxilii TaxID=1621989 RepID=A0A7V0I9K9_DESA2|nr:ABC transporter ATP-binding protein [Candidatus Desulfofervidus auxilii]